MTALQKAQVSSSRAERRYEQDSDRLFLVYYALPPGLNTNKWGVSPTSLDANIRSAINKPVIIYRKNPNNILHTKQAGNFVHPTPEEAALELGHSPNEEEYYRWQEKFAVGRIIDVDKRKEGYAWTLEITDPESKSILRDPRYDRALPGWTSPQIINNPRISPKEGRDGIYDHWAISHVILTDSPAYGYDKASLRASCNGEEKTCRIQTKNASQENLGFCVKQATIDLVQAYNSNSSLKELQSNSTNIMSTNETQPVTNTNKEVVVTKTLSEQNQKQDSDASPSGFDETNQQERAEEERKTPQGEETERLSLPKTLEEAHKTILQLVEQTKSKDEMLRSTNKEMQKILKWKDQIEAERKDYMLRSVIPRQLFKSDDSYNKEIQRITSLGLDKDLDFLKEHYQIMSQARLAQEQTELKPQQIKVKSASLEREIPEYDSQTKALDNSSLIQKSLDLQRKMFGGART